MHCQEGSTAQRMLPRDASCHPSGGKQLAGCWRSDLISYFFWLEHSWAAPRVLGNTARHSPRLNTAPCFLGMGKRGLSPVPHLHCKVQRTREVTKREKTTSVRRLHLPCPARPCPARSCPQALQLCSPLQGGLAPFLGLRRCPGGSPRPGVLTAHGNRGQPWICTSCRSVGS